MDILRRQKGYTLIEVLVATAVFLIAILVISGFMMQGYRAMGKAGKRTTNLHLTQADVEAAVADPDGDSEGEDVVVTREDYVLEVFGRTVGGTLITVKKAYEGQFAGEVTYYYFVPDEGED